MLQTKKELVYDFLLVNFLQIYKLAEPYSGGREIIRNLNIEFLTVILILPEGLILFSQLCDRLVNVTSKNAAIQKSLGV